ncbi:cytochrome P450 [Streptomyces sp. NPDC007901]|uniref:cytochrome P450 n=1 Tax=Streptomyces sp. NPDC007901 TaxID=3364785 RepID=UPI0036EB23AF
MNASPAIPATTPVAPGRLPLIGHAHHLARSPLPFITSLREHGQVVRIDIGTAPAYVVTDPALTRRVLVTDAAQFEKGGKIIDALRVFFGDGLATVADGDIHLRNRRLMQPMFNKAHIATRGAAMIEQVRSMVTAWEPGAARDVYADMNDITLAAFLVALFGTGLPSHLQRDFTALMPAIMAGTIRQTVLPSWITRLPLPANRAHAERVAQLRRLIDQAIDRRSAHGTGPETQAAAAACPHATEHQAEGLFSTLLSAEDYLSRQQLQDEAITLLTGAIETTGTTLAWTLYELTQNPDIERRLREELASVCPDRPVTYDDLDRLAYGRNVLQEAVRKYGPAWMVTRTATQDTELAGHLIPEGADVVWSPYLHQHDPEYFPEPETFDPDRWTAERTAATRGAFLAFGDGRRKCIGENFAWAELQIILTAILQTWPRIALASCQPKPKAVVTVKPDTLKVVFLPADTSRKPAADGNGPSPQARKSRTGGEI